MADTVKRMNYYDHQFLREADFTDEQTYHLSMRRRHNKFQHTPGVAEGLKVTVATGTSVDVSPGSAIDSEGREIVLPTGYNLTLSGAANTTFYITIAYDEQPSNPASGTDVQGKTRITESPKVAAFQTAPTDNLTLILATVALTGSGLGQPDESLRKKAGVVVGSDLAINNVKLEKEGVDQAKWPVLTCSAAYQASFANAGLVVNGNVGIGTTTPSSRLHVAGGDVTVPDGLLHVGGGANQTQGAYLGWNALTGGTGETDFINNQGGGTGGFAFMNTPLSGNPKTTLMVIGGNGNVGIGTTTPQKPLDVAGSGGLRISQTAEASNTNEIYFADNGQIRSFDDEHRIIFNRAANELEFREFGTITFSPGATQGQRTAKVAIDTNGNVGIGTQTPGAPLHVTGVAAVGPFAAEPGRTAPGRLTVTGPSAEIGFARRDLTAWPATAAAGDRYVWYSPDKSSARLWTYVKGDLLAVDPAGNVSLTGNLDVPSGNVGIGTSSPARRLEVNQDTPTAFSISDRLFLDGSSGSTVRITNNAYINNSAQWAIADATNKAATIEIRNSGVVDIYGAKTAGQADWKQMASFDAANNQVVFPNGNVYVQAGRFQDQKIRSYVATPNRVDTTSTSFVDIPNMSMTVNAAIGASFLILVQLNGVQITGAGQAGAVFRLLVDGTQSDWARHEFNHNGWEMRGVTLSRIMYLAAGSHTISVQWYTTAGTLTCCWYNPELRQILVIEL